MRQKIFLALTMIGIILVSGCVSSNNDDVNPSRIAPIIVINDLRSYKLNEPVGAKIGFLQYNGEDFNTIPNFNISGVVINPKGIEYPLSIKEITNEKIYRGEFKYGANFSGTDMEGTYTIRVSTSAGKSSSSVRTANFVVGKPSKLSLRLSSGEPHKFSIVEKEAISKTSEAAKAFIKGVATAMGENASGVDTIPELKPDGSMSLTAEIGADTGAVPIIERPQFVGTMIISNNFTVNIPSSEFEKWTYIETKGNKTYYKYDYLLPFVGDYNITLFVKDGSWPDTYAQSESDTVGFSFK